MAVVGTTITLLGLALVQAATTRALVDLDAGRKATAIGAYRRALRRFRPLLGGLLLGVAACVVLSVTAVLIPVAIWLAVRCMLLTQAVEAEDCSAFGGLRRSARLVRGRWFRVASLVGVGGLLALAAGPLVGAALIALTDAPLALLNIVAGVVYAVAMPFVALTTTYVYFDARVSEELEPATPALLPREVELSA